MIDSPNELIPEKNSSSLWRIFVDVKPNDSKLCNKNQVLYSIIKEILFGLSLRTKFYTIRRLLECREKTLRAE